MAARAPLTGTVWRTLALRIERVAVRPGTRMSGHGHDVPHICFLSMGAFEERDRGRTRVVRAGTVRTSPAGDQHDMVFTAPSECLLILVQGDPAASAPRLPADRRFLDSRRVRSLIDRFDRSLTHHDPPSPLALEALTLELLGATAAASGGREDPLDPFPPAWIDRVRDRIHSAPADPPTASDIALEVGYHPVYVARAFRQHYGVGLGEYARLVRAERARTMLESSETPLARVALRAGYTDQSHMTRAMRRLVGATPGEVRRRRGRLVEVSSIQDSGDTGR